MSVAVLPANEDEPAADSRLWATGIARVLLSAARASDMREKRDHVVLAGAHLLGWLEAIDTAPAGDR
jgi:hypothetical protein